MADRPSRKDTTMIAANLQSPISLALGELAGRLGIERGHRVTVQDALGEALYAFFLKYGQAPPEGLPIPPSEKS